MQELQCNRGVQTQEGVICEEVDSREADNRSMALIASGASVAAPTCEQYQTSGLFLCHYPRIQGHQDICTDVLHQCFYQGRHGCS